MVCHHRLSRRVECPETTWWPACPGIPAEISTLEDCTPEYLPRTQTHTDGHWVTHIDKWTDKQTHYHMQTDRGRHSARTRTICQSSIDMFAAVCLQLCNPNFNLWSFCWKSTHQLFLPWETYTSIWFFLQLFVFESGLEDCTIQVDERIGNN